MRTAASFEGSIFLSATVRHEYHSSAIEGIFFFACKREKNLAAAAKNDHKRHEVTGDSS